MEFHKAMVDPEKSCVCRAIVTRTYREMIAKGCDDGDAFRSAVTVYQLRHPEVTKDDAPYVVAEWICDDAGQ